MIQQSLPIARPRPIIRGFTLHRTWDHWMAEGVKPIENRDWPPPAKMLGHFLALHAGLHIDEEGENWIRQVFPKLVWPAQRGAPSRIVTVVRLVGVVDKGAWGEDRRLIMGKIPEWFYEFDWRWFRGRYGWLVEAPEGGRARPLRFPVPCGGHQGLWNLDEYQRQQIEEQVPLVHAA